MLIFLKSLSRTVHYEVNDEQVQTKDESLCKSLTVWRKSLVLSCNGFTVIDSDGNLVYRVDNYMEHPSEIVLMDRYGRSILSVRRSKHKLRLVDDWLIYKEGSDCNSAKSIKQRPILVAKKHINHMLEENVNLLVDVYHKVISNKTHAYAIEGCYAQRSCKIYNRSRKVVAEMKKKDADVERDGVSFGSEVFVLIIRPGFDQGLAMAIVLLLDQMFS